MEGGHTHECLHFSIGRSLVNALTARLADRFHTVHPMSNAKLFLHVHVVQHRHAGGHCIILYSEHQ